MTDFLNNLTTHVVLYGLTLFNARSSTPYYNHAFHYMQTIGMTLTFHICPRHQPIYISLHRTITKKENHC